MIKNKKILISGGAGYLGQNCIKRWYNDNDIVVFSRDESKHYYLKKQFPKVKFVIGDIRNYSRMLEISKDCQIGIFAASLKQIEACDENPEEAINTIIIGALNSKKVAIENNFESACFISSDKSRSPTTIYGSCKHVAGESFIVNAEQYSTKLTSGIWGNILNSTGSIIPLIHHALKNKYPLKLYGESMTRFLISIKSAVELIEHSLGYTGVNIIPKLKSCKISDLFEIYSQFGLQYSIGQPRISEKIDEIMWSKEEAPRITEVGNYYHMHYKNIDNQYSNEYSSGDVHNLLSLSELDSLLKNYNYFNPS